VLWGGRRVEELALLESAALGPRERDFATAARRAARRQRWTRRALLVAAPTVLLGTILAVQAWNRHAAIARADAAVTRALRQMAVARHETSTELVLRDAAFAAYDAGADKLGQALWRGVLRLSDEERVAYEEAREPINEALARVGGYEPARRAAADVAAALCLLAERGQDTKGRDTAARDLRIFDDQRRYVELAAGLGFITVHTRPPAAGIVLARFADRDADGILEEEQLGPIAAELPTGPWPAGSYLLTLTAQGHDTLRYPFLLARGAKTTLTIPLAPRGSIPAGFVYVPAGRSLFGASSVDPSTEHQSPLRERYTAAFLISRTEVTFGDWAEYVQALPPKKQSNAALHGLLSISATGQVMMDLRQWQGTLMAPGEMQRYTMADFGRERDHVDWRRWPVMYVSFEDALQYAAWLDASGRAPGARMCTEVEWERAARGADGRPFALGYVLRPSDASFGETYGLPSAGRRWLDEVGSFPNGRSVYGVDDMIGSVGELVAATRPGLTALKAGEWRKPAALQRADRVEIVDAQLRSTEIGLRICAPSPI
jgi:eukaryotic-like serine/threonine-protein kinase